MAQPTKPAPKKATAPKPQESKSDPNDTTSPKVSESEPLVNPARESTRAERNNEQDEGGVEGSTAESVGASSDQDLDAGGGDGVTYSPAVGTSSELAGKLSTKEGGRPLGMEQDGGTTDNPAGPGSSAEAALGARAPAGVVVGKQQINDVGESVESVLREFANLRESTKIFPTSNIHDDLRIQRAHVIQLAAKLEEELGIDITPSEAQNFLLVRDITNLAMRKLAIMEG